MLLKNLITRLTLPYRIARLKEAHLGLGSSHSFEKRLEDFRLDVEDRRQRGPWLDAYEDLKKKYSPLEIVDMLEEYEYLKRPCSILEAIELLEFALRVNPYAFGRYNLLYCLNLLQEAGLVSKDFHILDPNAKPLDGRQIEAARRIVEAGSLSGYLVAKRVEAEIMGDDDANS